VVSTPTVRAARRQEEHTRPFRPGGTVLSRPEWGARRQAHFKLGTFFSLGAQEGAIDFGQDDLPFLRVPGWDFLFPITIVIGSQYLPPYTRKSGCVLAEVF